MNHTLELSEKDCTATNKKLQIIRPNEKLQNISKEIQILRKNQVKL